MAPAMVLGLHKRAVHNVAGRPRNAKRNKGTTKAEAEPVTPTTPDRPALALLHGAGADAKRGSRAPDADGLATALGRIYAYAGYFVWSTIVDRDPTVPPHLREQLVAELAPTGKEGVATVHPLARVLAQTPLNRKYGAGLIDNLDVADCVAAIGDQVTRARNYLAQRRQLGPAFGATPGVGQPPVATPGAPSYGVPPNPAAGGYAGPENPNWGTVVDADMVAAMRANGGAPPAPSIPVPGPEVTD